MAVEVGDPEIVENLTLTYVRGCNGNNATILGLQHLQVRDI